LAQCYWLNLKPSFGRIVGLMAGFLEQINTPEDLKKLSVPVPDLKTLAGEIRRLILDSVSRTGEMTTAHLIIRIDINSNRPILDGNYA